MEIVTQMEDLTSYFTTDVHNDITIGSQLEVDLFFKVLIIITIVFQTTVACFGLGNLAIIYYTVRQTFLKRPFNMYVCAMAIGDVVMSDLVLFMDLKESVDMASAHTRQSDSTWCTVKVSYNSK